MAFKISDEIIPVPPRKRGSEQPIYLFADMQVGQHFDAPRDKGRTKHGSDWRQSSISRSANLWVKRHNPTAKFAVRIVDENTVRCWRIA